MSITLWTKNYQFKINQDNQLGGIDWLKFNSKIIKFSHFSKIDALKTNFIDFYTFSVFF